jgi:hypothetical protein
MQQLGTAAKAGNFSKRWELLQQATAITPTLCILVTESVAKIRNGYYSSPDLSPIFIDLYSHLDLDLILRCVYCS